MGACAIGFGKALPALEVNNSDLELLVQTNDEWISSRTGISSRRIAVGETVLDLAIAASSAAMGITPPQDGAASGMHVTGHCDSPIDPASIDLVVLTTLTPDVLVPCTAAALKKLMGLENAIAFDMNAACTGFIYGTAVADSMIAASQVAAAGFAGRNPIRRALVVSAERLTRLVDWQDRNTCVLFGDGAGAMVLEWRDDAAGIMSTYLKNDDDDSNVLTCKQSYSSPFPFDEDGIVCDEQAKQRHDEEFRDPKQVDYSYISSLGVPCDPAEARIQESFDIEDRVSKGGPDQYISMNGQRVFKFAARAMESAVLAAVKSAGLSLDDIDYIVPHQANLRIIEFAAKRLGLPLDKFQLSIDKTGNTSSSGVPMALADAICDGKVGKGSKVVLVAFGGGLTSGALLMEL